MGKRLLSLLVTISMAFTTISAFKGREIQVKAETTENYSWNNVQIEGGGFIPGIIFSNVEKDLIYARTDMGGIYRWQKDTETWKPLTDWVGYEDWNYLGCESIATDPIEANKVYAAIGTYTNDWTSQNGAILRSEDYGDTWDIVELPFKVGGNMPGRSMGERLAIDPNDNNILYLGTRSGNGLWRSTDAGKTWNKVTSFTAVGNYTDAYKDIVGVTWVQFDKNSGVQGKSKSQTIYVGVADTNNSVYKSTDGGATWSAVSGQPTGYLPHQGKISDNGYLYVTYGDKEGPYEVTKGDVYRMNLTTGTWENISPVPSTSSDCYYGYGGISIDGSNPNVLLVSALNPWWPDAQFYRSLDGGVTWSPIWSWSNYPERDMKYTMDISSCPWLDFGMTTEMPTTAPKLGWMVGDIEIDPFDSDRMMYGTGATLYSSNNLTNWDKNEKITIKPTAKGIEETAVLALISPNEGAEVISGLGDIGGFTHTDVTKVMNNVFTTPAFTSTTSLDYAELNSKLIVRVGTGDNVKHFAYSTDGGNSWNEGSGTITGETGGGKVCISPDGKTVLWSPDGEGAKVSYSTNNGASWTASNGIPDNSYIISDRVDSNIFYGFSEGNVYVSNDGGKNFTKTSQSGLPQSVKSTFKAMPGVSKDIWLPGAKDGLYHSVDGGESFTKLENVEAAEAIGFGKAAPGKDYMALYICGKVNGVRGVFRSIDKGETWVRINDDNNQWGAIEAAITGDPKVYGRVYVGTNGRGVQYGDIVTGGTEETKNSTIDKNSITIDKNTEETKDITIGVTLNGNILTSIKNNNTSLKENVDYVINSDNSVTIKKAYIDSLPEGNNKLTFNFSKGTSPILNIKIVNKTIEVSSNEAINLDLETYTAATSTSNISLGYKLTNTGDTTLDLTKIKLRYYFKDSSNKSFTSSAQSSISMDKSPWYVNLSGNIKVDFVKMDNSTDNANYYMEVSYTSGELEAGYSLSLSVGFNYSDWDLQDQSDDYSYGKVENTTVYYNNSLLWGTAPNTSTILDLSSVASRYRSKIGDNLYDEKYDINKDGIIDIVDIVLIAKTM